VVKKKIATPFSVILIYNFLHSPIPGLLFIGDFWLSFVVLTVEKKTKKKQRSGGGGGRMGGFVVVVVMENY
jgi:hypothetical protein